MDDAQKRIENLLKKDDETEFETSNMREFISQHSIEIKKAKEISFYQESIDNRYKRRLCPWNHRHKGG